MNVSDNYEELNFDVPNLHLLMEFLYRTLPALQNTHFSRSGPFETHHKQVKRGMLNLALFFFLFTCLSRILCHNKVYATYVRHIILQIFLFYDPNMYNLFMGTRILSL